LKQHTTNNILFKVNEFYTTSKLLQRQGKPLQICGIPRYMQNKHLGFSADEQKLIMILVRY
jgi:hypothetical protein